MSTANKLTYLNQTKQKLKQAINNIGGSIDDNTTFRQYANQLQNVYDNLSKTEYQEGTEVNLGVTTKGKLDYDKVYQEVEYIESTGTQYIDTGILPNSNQKIETKLAWLSTGNIIAMGSRSSGAYNTSTNQIYLNYNSQLEGVPNKALFVEGPYLGDPQDIIGDDIILGKPQTYVLNLNKYQLTQTSKNYYLFCLNNIGTSAGSSAIQLYYVKIYDNNVLVRDFIPCYHISDNVIGLYDKVEGKFYTNAGTGTFTKGADVGNGFVDIVGIGQSSQDSISGTQRIDTNEYIAPTTKNGVTYSLENGLFTFNGTASAGFDIMLSNKVSLEAGAYTMAPSDESGSYTGVFGKYAYVAEVGVGNIIDGGQVRTVINKTLESDYNNKVQLHFYIASGVVFSNYKFKVNLVKGTYTAQTIPNWEPYTGGQASPNPSYPQEIRCVAGRNKADPSKLNLGKTLSNNGALIDLHSRTTSFQNQVEPNTSYALSVNSGYQIGNLFYYDKNKTYSSSVESAWANSKVITIPNNAYYVSFAIARTDNATMTESDVEALHLQIEQGTQATPYLPYNTIEEVVSGINLANVPLPYDTNESGATTKWINFSAIPQFEIGKTYYLYGKCSDGTYLTGSNSALVIMKSSSQFLNKPFQQAFTCNIDISEATGWYIWTNSSLAGKTITEIGIYEGNSNKPYEPYITPTSYQLSLGDIELNAIGNYKDELIYDVDEDKVYKNEKIGKKLYNGTEEWRLQSPDGTKLVYTRTENDYLRESGIGCFCNYYKGVENGTVGTIQDNECRFRYFSDDLYEIYICNNSITSVDDFKTWLQTHNTEVRYVLATATQTEITDTTLINQVKALYNAHSLNGTTIITPNGNLPMIIKCRGLKGE